jgi:hypothetical protein
MRRSLGFQRRFYKRGFSPSYLTNPHKSYITLSADSPIPVPCLIRTSLYLSPHGNMTLFIPAGFYSSVERLAHSVSVTNSVHVLSQGSMISTKHGRDITIVG